MSEVSYFISVTWMFIQVSKGRGMSWVGGGERARGSRVARFVNECEEVDNWWLRRDSGNLSETSSVRFVDFCLDKHDPRV